MTTIVIFCTTFVSKSVAELLQKPKKTEGDYEFRKCRQKNSLFKLSGGGKRSVSISKSESTALKDACLGIFKQ